MRWCNRVLSCPADAALIPPFARWGCNCSIFIPGMFHCGIVLENSHWWICCHSIRISWHNSWRRESHSLLLCKQTLLRTNVHLLIQTRRGRWQQKNVVVAERKRSLIYWMDFIIWIFARRFHSRRVLDGRTAEQSWSWARSIIFYWRDTGGRGNLSWILLTIGNLILWPNSVPP